MKLLFISLLIVVYFFRLSHINQYQIPLDRPVKIQGRITKQPYPKGSYQIIDIGPISVITDRFPGYDYGEKIQLVGRFSRQLIIPFWPQYLTSFPAIQKIDDAASPPLKISLSQFFLKIRGRIERKLVSFLPEPEASLLLGVVFGVKTQMPENLLQNLRKTGTIHLVVASGQNVAIVAGFLIETLVLLIKRRRAVFLALAAIFGYALMVGAQPPVIRAVIMVSMAYAAQLFGREGEGIRLLLVAAVIMLLVSPLILFDIGFQLSFGATTGIMAIYPKLRPKFKRFPVLGVGLATTLGAQLATLPILLTNFGTFSFISPLVNALVLPVIPLIMSLGGILAVVSSVVSPLGQLSWLAQLLAWLIWPILRYFVMLVEHFGNLSWATWEVGKLSLLWAVGYYLVLGVWISKK